MNTPRLSPAMMARYDIEDRRPARVSAAQFGAGEALLGAVDRLLDDAGIGVACVARGSGPEQLKQQEGLYTLIIRGYAGDAPVNREQVVQCLRELHDTPDAPALNPDIALSIVDNTPQARADAARFVLLRRSAGLAPVPELRLGENLIADSLAFRAEADEAAMLCKAMNYLDGMLHLAEPFVRLTACAPAGMSIPGAVYTNPDGLAHEALLKRRVFDAGLALMAAPGWLNGCDTLSDAMKHPRLRKCVGETFTGELLPLLSDLPRAEVEARVIESFARYENPLNRNRLLRAARPLEWFATDGIPLIRNWADENFEAPRGLTFALSATVMLLAGARPDPDTGRYTVARGRHTEALDGDPERLAVFSTLSHDMPPEALAYAVLADRELWNGMDLREIDGLEQRLTLDLAAMQRDPAFLPG